jgi:uncharacterized YigZ family protein
MKAFTTLKDIATHQEIIKESVFIAYGGRADSQDEAFRFLRAVMGRHPDASHLCWAYRIGDQYRFSDGGEPGGTAGQPILRAIEGQALDHIVVGVIRYFGGTKLGAGGLMRAYGGAAAEALRTAERTLESPRIQIMAAVGFEHVSVLYRALETCGAAEREEDYSAAGITLTASLPAEAVERFQALLRDGTRGQFELIVPEA